jgi:probable F420-dependent oxidoreductase
MKFALHFSNNTFPDGAGAKRLARLAEAAGFDSVLAIDHVVLPEDYASSYPYSATGRLPGSHASHYPDPLVWMAYVAAATTRLRLMTGVIILPQRNPLVLAKQIATLDHMSGGRIELGIGVGWLKEEFAALGIPFERRGKRADEYVAAMRALWRGDNASFAGVRKFSAGELQPEACDGQRPNLCRRPLRSRGETCWPHRRWLFSIDWCPG